jgi:hypothetical protein
MKITSNQHELSLSLVRPDTTILDFCVMRPTLHGTPELVIGLGDSEGEEIKSIHLTVAEAQALRAHLNSTPVQQVFRQGQHEHIGAETAYMRAVKITEPLVVPVQ